MTTTASTGRAPLWAKLFLTLLASSLVAAACGDDGDGPADPVAPATTSSTGAADATADVQPSDAMGSGR